MIHVTSIVRLDAMGGSPLMETHSHSKTDELLALNNRLKKTFRSMDDRTPEQIVIQDKETKPLYKAHCLKSRSTVYVAITDASHNAPQAFAYLQEVRSRFSKEHPENTYTHRTLSAYPYQAFENDIADLMKQYSDGRNYDAIKVQLDEVKDIMYTNIEAAIQRGTAISEMSDKSAHLREASIIYKKDSTDLNKWLLKNKALVGGVVLFITFFMWLRFF